MKRLALIPALWLCACASPPPERFLHTVMAGAPSAELAFRSAEACQQWRARTLWAQQGNLRCVASESDWPHVIDMVTDTGEEVRLYAPDRARCESARLRALATPAIKLASNCLPRRAPQRPSL